MLFRPYNFCLLIGASQGKATKQLWNVILTKISQNVDVTKSEISSQTEILTKLKCQQNWNVIRIELDGVGPVDNRPSTN